VNVGLRTVLGESLAAELKTAPEMGSFDMILYWLNTMEIQNIYKHQLELPLSVCASN